MMCRGPHHFEGLKGYLWHLCKNVQHVDAPDPLQERQVWQPSDQSCHSPHLNLVPASVQTLIHKRVALS